MIANRSLKVRNSYADTNLTKNEISRENMEKLEKDRIIQEIKENIMQNCDLNLETELKELKKVLTHFLT